MIFAIFAMYNIISSSFKMCVCVCAIFFSRNFFVLFL